MSSYYKKINGQNYDKAMLDIADKSIEGKGDGRVSLSDAKAIFKKAKDGGRITDTELRTLNHILENYKFTEPALKYIEDSLSDNLVLKDKGTSVNEQQENPKKESKQEVKPIIVQNNEKKSSKLKYFIIFLCFLLLLLLFLLINFLCKKNAVLTDNDEIVPVVNNVVEEKKDPINTEKNAETNTENSNNTKNLINLESSKNTEDSKNTENSNNIVQNNKNEYVVKQYDTLAKISQAIYGDYKYWKNIYKANTNKIKNPVLIYPGQVLTIPEKNK